MRIFKLCASALLPFCLGIGLIAQTPTDSWPTYHGDFSGQRHSRLNEISPENINRLAKVWTFQTGQKQQIKATPMNQTLRVEGSILLEESNNRRYDAKIEGTIELRGEALSRFDLLVQGPHTAKKPDVGEIPTGAATLAVAFTLLTPGDDPRIPPLYTWHGDYLKTDQLRVPELRKSSSN